MREEPGRDDWLRKRVFQLEKVITMIVDACGHDNPDDRNRRLLEALEELPQ
jgi:hypothetical protein